MLGVVLWSDNQDKKAVIWCEDQGELAYFNGGRDAPLDSVDLDAGDLVHFDLQQERHMRYARNPRRIEQAAFPGIADDLKTAAQPKQPDQIAPCPKRRVETADIIPFVRPSAEPELALA